MNYSTTLRNSTMWLAILGMLLPSVSFGASPTVTVHDVALRADRSLHGRVVDLKGQGRADQPVSIIQAGNVVGKTTTNANGDFVLADLKSGKYSVQAAEQLVQYRTWPSEAAPPTVMDPVIYSSSPMDMTGPIGGQFGPTMTGPIGNLLSSPIGLAAVAAAIAVPIALGDDDDAS